MILTSNWSTPSPDPTGLDLMNGQLLVTDSEVDETSLDKGRNVWRTSRRGLVKRSMSTYFFSHEPTDIASDMSRNVWYFSDDTPFHGVLGSINVKGLGADHIYGTRDDHRRTFSTGAFGSHDPEGLAFGGGSLWISDGTTGTVYRIDPGPNLKIEGAGTDDIITSLNLSGLGVTDIEGVEFANDRLFVVANQKNADILEINPADGSLIRAFDLSTAGIRHPSALAYGAASQDPSQKSFYVADRGIDNNGHPHENDGKIVELGVAATPPNLIKNGGFERDINGNHRPDFWTERGIHTDVDCPARWYLLGPSSLVCECPLHHPPGPERRGCGRDVSLRGLDQDPATTDTSYRLRIVWFGSTGARIGRPTSRSSPRKP